MIDDAIAFADTHLNIAFELIEVLFRVNEMKIVPRLLTGGLNLSAFSLIHFSMLIGDCTLVIDMSVFLRV